MGFISSMRIEATLVHWLADTGGGFGPWSISRAIYYIMKAYSSPSSSDSSSFTSSGSSAISPAPDPRTSSSLEQTEI